MEDKVLLFLFWEQDFNVWFILFPRACPPESAHIEPNFLSYKEGRLKFISQAK